MREIVPKYQTWSQWYKRLASRAKISNPDNIRLMTNRYTLGYYLYASDVRESVISEQLGLRENVKFYKSFCFSSEPNREDIKKYTDGWKGNTADRNNIITE